MRLTLRTLLAYLDDLLEPSQAKELGAKVQESEFAAELVMKIRDVIRKRRLTAPVVSGPGCDLDANTVAEYLDNTLSPDGVTDLERLCLESDVHLAEVAASHQILTLVLGEPVDISSLSRERMYALGEAAKGKSPAAAASAPAPAANGNGVTVAVKPPAAVPAAVAPATVGGLGPAVKSVTGGVRLSTGSVSTVETVAAPAANKKTADAVDRTVPDYLKTTPLWKRVLPAAVVLLFLVWLGTIFNDEILSGVFGKKSQTTVAGLDNKSNAKPDQGAADAKVGSDDNEAVSPEIAPEEAELPPAEMPEDQGAGETTVAAGDKNAVDAAAPQDAAATGEEFEPTSAAKPGTGKASKSEPNPDNAVAKVDPNPELNKPAPATKPAAPAVRTPPSLYVSQDGIVLRYDADRQGWFQLPYRANVTADDALAVPDPFEAQIQLGREKHRLTIMGPAVAGLLDATADQPMGINVMRGRVVLQPAEAAAGKPQPPCKLRLSVHGTTWILELTDPTTRCGIEVIPREPRRFEENFGSATWSGTLYVWSGALRITNTEGMTHSMMGPDSYVLARDPSMAESQPTPAADLPNWERKLPPLAQKNARYFDSQFTSDGSSAHDALLGMVSDKAPALSKLGVSCLGLIGDYDLMVQVLDRNSHYESRVAAINSLRTWINQDPENRVKLKASIQSKIPIDPDVVYKLIWGFQESDLRNKLTSEELVDDLEHQQMAVRELAWYYIKSLTNRKSEVFDAMATVGLTHRDPVVVRLQKHLEKEGSLLPALPAAKAPAPANP